MNHVTFETARRLKEAGFPQPAPDLGQVWYYNGGGFLQVVEFDNEQNMPIIYAFGSAYYERRPYWNQLIFACAATDILKELPGYYLIRYGPHDMPNLPMGFAFGCINPSRNTSWNDDNPAEACALAWLAIHEKKS